MTRKMSAHPSRQLICDNQLLEAGDRQGMGPRSMGRPDRAECANRRRLSLVRNEDVSLGGDDDDDDDDDLPTEAT